MVLRRLLGLLVIVYSLLSPVWAQVGISPRTLDVVLDEDGRSHSFRLFNLGKQTYQVKVSVTNWTMDENSEVQLIPSTAESLDQWMIVNPLSFDIPPGESQTVRVGFRPQMALPQGEYRALVYFEQQLPPDDKPDTKQLRSLFRLGAAVYVHVGEVVALANIDQVNIVGDQAQVSITNLGNTHVRLDGQWSAWRADAYPGAAITHQIPGLGKNDILLPEGVVSAGWLPRTPVLPGHTRTLKFDLSGLPAQAARLVLDMDAQFADKALDRADAFDWVGHVSPQQQP